MPTQEVRNYLLAMADSGGGRISAEEVVKAAQPKDHPLHNEFEWDNKVAGHKFRVDQARALIRTIEVTVTRRELTFAVPVFLRDPEKRTPQQGYATLSRIRSKEDYAKAAVQAEFQRAAAALKRAQAVADALGLADQVEELLADMSNFLSLMGTISSEGGRPALHS